jgi:membrane protease YdiL (CAAX protease family)
VTGDASERARRNAKVVGGVGAVLFWVVLGALASLAEVPVADAILISVLLVGVPVLAIAQVPIMESQRMEGARVDRMSAYMGSIMALWLLAGACYLVGSRRGAVSLGLVATSLPMLALWTIGLTLAGLLIILCFREIAIRADVDESPVLRELLPDTPRERQTFFGLSIAAGVGEELAYRGYAIPVLTTLLGTGGAVALTSVVFGAVHAYQGVLGVVRTGLMGAVLAWGFLSSGSILPAMFAHTLIDVLAGLVLAEKLLPPPRVHGVVRAPERFPDTER